METALGFLAAITFILFLFGFISLCYKRANKKTAYFRSGYGGEQLLLNKNAFAFPGLHHVIPVNLSAQCLNISAKNAEALLTKDLLNLNISVDFYVRVPADQEHITKAAQTLGKITTQRLVLKKFLAGKFLSGLREAAATMTMNEILLMQREFIVKVQRLMEQELLLNGLRLESLAIKNIHPTSIEFYQQDTPLAATAKTQVMEEIAQQQQKQSNIELKTIAQIKAKELESEQLLLDIEKNKQLKRFEQQQQISLCQAAMESELAKNSVLIDQEQQQARQQVKHTLALETLDKDAELNKIKEEQKNAQKERTNAKQQELATQLNKQELFNIKRLAEEEVNKVIAIANAEKKAALIYAEAEQIKTDSKIKATERISQAERQKFSLEVEGINEITQSIQSLSESGFPERLQDNLINIISGLINSSHDPVLRTETSIQARPELVTEIKNNKESNLKRDKLQALLKEANHSLNPVTEVKVNQDNVQNKNIKSIPLDIESTKSLETLRSIQP